jgi:hypothetical protein
VCAIASLLVHLGLLQPVLLGSVDLRPKQKESGPGASATSSDDGTYITLILVNTPSNSEHSVEEKVVSVGVTDSNSPFQIASSNSAPWLQPDQFETEEVDEEAAHTAGDPAIQSKLFGSYTSQIDARIRRAWIKPRGAIAPQTTDAHGRTHQKDTFTCSARITQDDAGRVAEVELMQCDGSSEWQMSLVDAIQRASPLPSPPSPTVFTNVLTLSFEGKAYKMGYREDEYESRPIEIPRARFAQ